MKDTKKPSLFFFLLSVRYRYWWLFPGVLVRIVCPFAATHRLHRLFYHLTFFFFKKVRFFKECFLHNFLLKQFHAPSIISKQPHQHALFFYATFNAWGSIFPLFSNILQAFAKKTGKRQKNLQDFGIFA